MRFIIETYGRSKGDSIATKRATLGKAISVAKRIKKALEKRNEYDVYIDIFSEVNAKFVREGFMPSNVSFVSGSSKVAWNGKVIS